MPLVQRQNLNTNYPLCLLPQCLLIISRHLQQQPNVENRRLHPKGLLSDHVQSNLMTP